MTPRRSALAKPQTLIPVREVDRSAARRRATTNVVVMGEFDGLHRGHRALVVSAGRLAQRSDRALVAVVMADRNASARLSPLSVRSRTLIEWGVSAVFVQAVDRASQDDVEELAGYVARDVLPYAICLACAPSESPRGSYPSLRAAFLRRHIDVVDVPRVLDDVTQAPISSSSLRQLLMAGDVQGTERLLGRPFHLAGEVVQGRQLGRTIGFPTANLETSGQQIIPSRGVYAGRALLRDGRDFAAAINVGTRPTVEQRGHMQVEAHLLNFDGDLYGQTLSLEFHRKVRDERRFATTAELIAQINSDVDMIRRSGTSPNWR
jgi:riboflavin kinase / FMN adenylyltransferase